MSNCSYDVFDLVASFNTWMFSFNLKKVTDCSKISPWTLRQFVLLYSDYLGKMNLFIENNKLSGGALSPLCVT